MRAMLLLSAALLFVAGCADHNSGQDAWSRPQEIARETVGNVETGIDTHESLPDLSGTVYLATELIATEPTDQLNEAWAAMVADYTLAIAFVVVAHDVASQTMEVDLTSAWIDRLLQDDKPVRPQAYRFALEPVRLNLNLTGQEFTIDGTFAIDLVPMAVNKPFHVHGAVGSGSFSPDGQQITELRLEGFLSEDQMVDFCLNMPGLGDVNFHWFMNLAHLCADADSNADGVPDSYLFKGIVKATADSGLFLPGIKQIEPLVTLCPPHDQPCKPQ